MILTLLFLALGNVFAGQLEEIAGVRVVELLTTNAQGQERATKLWIVLHEGTLYLRAGRGLKSSWLDRLRQSTNTTLRAGEHRVPVRAEILAQDEMLRETVNRLMAEKYGWQDRLVGLVADRTKSVPVRLHLLANP